MRDNEKKTLVLGGSSFVGSHLLKRLGKNKVIATYNNHSIDGGVYFNAVDMRVQDILDQKDEVGYAVLLLGDTQPDSCVNNRERSELINVTSIKQLIDDLVELEIPIIFTSSEFVFDGHDGGYREQDPPNPILLYGQQKLAVEKYLVEAGADHTVLRLGKVYGLERDDQTLFTAWMHQIERGGSIQCAVDQAFSPVYVGDVVSVIIAVMERSLRGLYHLGGPVGMSRMALLEQMLDVAVTNGWDAVEIKPCSINDFDLPEKRPLDVSLNVDKLVSDAAIELMRPDQACMEVCRAWVEN